MSYALLAVMMLGGAYGIAIIWGGSRIIDGQRYPLLFDDAMISMRYAKNFAQGSGLVWNVGEPPIEGYTNLLWTLWMACLHWLGLNGRAVCWAIQFSGLACLMGAAWRLSRVSMALEQRWPGLLAAGLTLGCYPLVFWSTCGMEVGFLALAVVSAFEAGTRPGGRGILPVTAWLTLALWTRLDMLALAVPLWAGMHVSMPAQRRRASVGGILIVVTLGLVLPTIWRHVYYGAWLPNTFDLKMGQVSLAWRFLRGGSTMAKFLVCLLPLGALALAAFRKRGGQAHRITAGLVFVAAILYSVQAGGDAWEFWGGPNRFLAPAMPLFFLLVAEGAANLATTKFRTYCVGALLLVGFIWLLASRSPTSLKEAVLREPALYVEENVDLVNLGLALKDLDLPGLRLGVVSAGHLGYWSEKPCEDLYGKSDRAVARGPLHPSVIAKGWRFYTPGHAKWSFEQICGFRGPVLLMQVPPMNAEIFGYLRGCGYRTVNLPFGRHLFKGTSRGHP
jgi:hypothetical protein